MKVENIARAIAQELKIRRDEIEQPESRVVTFTLKLRSDGAVRAIESEVSVHRELISR